MIACPHDKGACDCLLCVWLGFLTESLCGCVLQATLTVPGAADDKHYIFAYRALNVRMRTASHLMTWYQRLLHKGMKLGVVHSYQTSTQQVWQRSVHPPDQSESASCGDKTHTHINIAGLKSSRQRHSTSRPSRDSTSPAAMFLSSNATNLLVSSTLSSIYT